MWYNVSSARLSIAFLHAMNHIAPTNNNLIIVYIYTVNNDIRAFVDYNIHHWIT